MSEWKECALGDVCYAQGGGTPSRQNATFWGGRIPWASVKDFTDGQRILHKTQESITKQGLKGSASRIIPAGVPLVCTRMAVGRSAIPKVDVAINQDVKALFPCAEVTGEYLQRFIEFSESKIGCVAIGSTVKGISTGQLLALRIAFPANETEQNHITEILDTLDEAIREAEAVIAKLRQVKAGLLHDLLTRGLDEHGHLRDPIRHPDQFQDSPLGLIPKAWQALTLGRVCELIKDGTHLPPKRVDVGPLLLGVQNIIDSKLQLTDSDSRVPIEFFEQMHRKWCIKPNDVLLAIVGATIGKVCQVPTAIETFTLQRSVALLRGNPSTMSNRYIFHFMSSAAFQAAIQLRTNSTAQPGLYLAQIGELLIPVPPLGEQQEICRLLDQLSEKAFSEQESLSKLQSLKRGLSHDLLSGRKRVKL